MAKYPARGKAGCVLTLVQRFSSSLHRLHSEAFDTDNAYYPGLPGVPRSQNETSCGNISYDVPWSRTGLQHVPAYQNLLGGVRKDALREWHLCQGGRFLVTAPS
ncbi:hypothetical protein AX14_006594 [Amanita brunnescens Koide BX004]|nr:hypothetical protein AX14_006594 [Amanita brunnescens Koide BX004]